VARYGAAGGSIGSQKRMRLPNGSIVPARAGVDIEAMIPIDREYEKPQVELVGLGDVEDAQNGDHASELDLHDVGLHLRPHDARGRRATRARGDILTMTNLDPDCAVRYLLWRMGLE
jgi:hypothetical protein